MTLIDIKRCVPRLAALVIVASVAKTATAASPGITGPSFNLVAQTAFLNQPDGSSVYSWGYGCNGKPSGFAPAAIPNATCPMMQIPGPTLIVTENQTVSVTLTNNLPPAAGNTSILFPGFSVAAAAATSQPASCTSATPMVQGLLVAEAANGCAVTYSFTATSPGTRSYYSGTQSDLQVEMGMYGAVIVLPANVPAACTTGLAASNNTARGHWGEADFRLAPAAYDHAKSCYDREYLFQFSEMDPKIHNAALAQVTATGQCAAGLTILPTSWSTDVPCRMTWILTTDLNIRTSPTTAILTCTPASKCCLGSSGRGDGSIRFTSTATTSASWHETAI
jgi:hypothetical protein